jgi:hypothetical protein
VGTRLLRADPKRISRPRPDIRHLNGADHAADTAATTPTTDAELQRKPNLSHWTGTDQTSDLRRATGRRRRVTIRCAIISQPADRHSPQIGGYRVPRRPRRYHRR